MSIISNTIQRKYNCTTNTFTNFMRAQGHKLKVVQERLNESGVLAAIRSKARPP